MIHYKKVDTFVFFIGYTTNCTVIKNIFEDFFMSNLLITRHYKKKKKKWIK
jgi:hypothetical protein